MKNINIIIGRFQPLTYGHLKCLKELYDETGMKIILCIIKVIDTNEKHPFKSAELIKIYKNIPELYKYIEDIIEVPNADIVKIEENLNKSGYNIKYWVCGSDRIKSYQKMVDKYAPEIKMLEIPRTDNDISATMVRQLLKDNNKKLFLKYTPIPEKYYNQLWREISVL